MSQDTAANKQNNMKFTSYLNTNYESLLNKGYRFKFSIVGKGEANKLISKGISGLPAALIKGVNGGKPLIGAQIISYFTNVLNKKHRLSRPPCS